MDDDPTTDIRASTRRARCREGHADSTGRDVAVDADRSTATSHGRDHPQDVRPADTRTEAAH